MKLGRTTALPLVAILVITAALNTGTAFAEEEAPAAPADAPDDVDESTATAQAAADAEQQGEHRPEEDWGSYYDPKGEFCGEYDCYSILGFDFESFGRSPPDTKEITQAYRLLSRKWHPDKQRGKNKDFAEERFVKINKAHKVLTNKRRRKEYDYLRDRPDEYIHKYGTNVQYSYAPKSDVVMVMLILLVVGNIFTYYVQKNRWQTVANHVVKLALEGATLRDGGSDESVAIREKALEILAKQKVEEADAAGTTGSATASATRRGSSGSAKGPSPTKKKGGGAKATKKEQKEQEMEELRPIVVRLVQEEHKDFGGGFHQPTWRDLLITKLAIQWPVQFVKAASWQLGYWGRRLRGIDLSDHEREVLTRRAVGEITWHSLSDEDRADACTQELWISTNLEDWREMQEVKKLGAGYQKKYNRWKRKQGSKLEMPLETVLYNSYIDASSMVTAAANTASDIHQRLTDELEAATREEELLRLQEATINENAKTIIEEAQATQGQSIVDSTEDDAAFELHRLKETHAALRSQLEDIEDENRQMVEPEMKRLHREESSLNKERELAKETYRLQQLEALVKASITERMEAEGKIKDGRIELTKGNDEPKAKEIKEIEKQIAASKKDIKQLEERAVDVQFSIDNAKRQCKDLDCSRRLVGRDIEDCKVECDARAQEAQSMEEKVGALKAQHHSLATKRLEAEIAIKKCNDSIRLSKKNAALEKKQLEYAKRKFVKKRLASDKAKDMVPEMQSNCQDYQVSLSTYKRQSLQNQVLLDEKKAKLHTQQLTLMRNQGIGSDKQKELLACIDMVEEKELQIEKERAEEKKFGKIIAVMQTQCNLVRKKASQMMEAIDDTREQSQVQSLTAQNIEKMCLETNKRCKEFAVLSETIKAKQNSCIEIIQASKKATADLKSKVESLEIKLGQTKCESSEKSTILSKEYDAHEKSVAHRANLRDEKNKVKSILREKKLKMERQEVQLKKLESRASTLEREVQTSHEQNRKASAAQCLLAGQLNDRVQELSRCSERSFLYRDSLEQSEAALKERTDFIRAQTLQRDDLRRTVEATKRTTPDARLYQDRISRPEADIIIETKYIEQLSLDLEDPNNLHAAGAARRTRPLEGEDLTSDQLVAQINFLENRLHSMQNRLLEKEVELETVSWRCREMEEQQAKNKREAKPLIQDLIICRGRAHGLSRKLISLMSELRMYQQSNIALSEEKTIREHALAVSKRASESGKPPSKEAQRLQFKEQAIEI